MPAAAVSAGGQDTVRSGSTSAIFGQLRMSNRFIFLRRAVSVMTADGLHTRVGDQHHPARGQTSRVRSGLPGHAPAEEHAGRHVELAVRGHPLAAAGRSRMRGGHGRAATGSASPRSAMTARAASIPAPSRPGTPGCTPPPPR